LALTSSFFIFNVGAKIVLLTNHTFDLTARLSFFYFYFYKSGDDGQRKVFQESAVSLFNFLSLAADSKTLPLFLFLSLLLFTGAQGQFLSFSYSCVSWAPNKRCKEKEEKRNNLLCPTFFPDASCFSLYFLSWMRLEG
jgi:hypothetical protein